MKKNPSVHISESDIKAFSLEGLVGLMKEQGQPRFRADQIAQWLYLYGVSSYEEMTNLPQYLRDSLAKKHPLGGYQIAEKQVSKDGTRKYLLRFKDGARVETVAISARSRALSDTFSQKNQAEHGKKAETPLSGAPSATNPRETQRGDAKSSFDSLFSTKNSTPLIQKGDFNAKDAGAAEDAGGGEKKSTTLSDSPKRLTVCFSTQVGCAMGCSFCATGTEGFTRNLLPGEIIDQILAAQSDFGIRVSNLVAMGQGEPFLNYENMLAALRFLNHPKGLAIGARRITVSTCGLIQEINRFAQEPEQFTLAVSLHSAEQEVRNLLMPKLSNQPLSQLRPALFNYVEQTNRRVSLEYTLIKDVNDTPEALATLLQFCSGLLCHVNLMPVNPTNSATPNAFNNKSSSETKRELNMLLPSSTSTIQNWQRQLEEKHVPVTIRASKGSDIAGACGQLTSQLQKK